MEVIFTRIVSVPRFNDYEQRAYDFDELEKKLLEWDKPEDSNGVEYNQGKLEV